MANIKVSVEPEQIRRTSERNFTGCSQNACSSNNDRCFLKSADIDECAFCRYVGKCVETSLKCGVCNIPICGRCFGLHKAKQTFACTKWNITDRKVSNAHCDIMTNECHKESSFNLLSSSLFQETGIAPPIIKLLKEKYNILPIVHIREDNNISFLFWQDDYMKKFHHYFPHCTCIVLLGKVSIATVYVFISEDSDARHEIILVAFDFTQTEEGLHSILQAFKINNSQWKQIKILVVDTQVPNHDKIQQAFPDALVVSCFYHSWKTFSQMFSSETKDKLENPLLMGSDLAFTDLACTEEEWKHLHDIMLSYCGNSQMFGHNWNVMLGMHKVSIDESENFLGPLNTYLCTVETKVKSLVLPECNFINFIQRIICLLRNLRRNNRIKREVSADNSQCHDRHSTVALFESFLTPYASKFIQMQMNRSSSFTPSYRMSEGYHQFDYKGKVIYATPTNCSCLLFSFTSLVCCHIFTLRIAYQLPMFEEIMFSQHLTKQYFYHSYSIICKDITDCSLLEAACIDKLLPIMVGESHENVVNKCFLLDRAADAYRKSHKVIPVCYGVNKTYNPIVNPSATDLAFQQGSVLPLASYGPTSSVREEKCEKSASAFSIENSSWTYGRHLLSGSKINLLYLKTVICGQKKSIVEWLQSKGFLPNIMICPSCNTNMVKSEMSRLTDGAIWICNNERKPKRVCARRCSVRKFTWFDDTSMSLEKILIFCYMWIHCFSQHQILLELGISSATYMAWDKTFLNVIVNGLSAYLHDCSMEQTENFDSMKSSWRKFQGTEDIFLMFLKDAESLYKKNIK